MAAVNQNMLDAGVIFERPRGASLLVLPLNLIAQIVSNVEDVGDLARLCRTCRVLNYMSLPQLYRSLTLISYDKIRYRNERPEGIGSASPFTMGLNTVITRPSATLIRSITLKGEWKAHDLEEHALVGRVPDSSMLLNIAVRAAVDRMANLESFSWELNTKMLDIVYAGLAQLPRLYSLTVRFANSRHPQPTCVLPPMPHLRALKITDIDPLCYPDDIATLLLKSRKLQALKLHWSPRMRIAQEPSVSPHDYFRKCISAKQPLAVKQLSFQNLYAFHSEEFNLAFDPTTVEDVTFLSGSDYLGLANSFVELSWPVAPPHKHLKIKSMRIDAITKRNADFLSNFKGLERFYIVNVTSEGADSLNSVRSDPSASSALTPPLSEHQNQTIPNAGSENSPAASGSPASQLSAGLGVQNSYLASITLNHGASLRHLLLSSKWPLSNRAIARLVHSCPNLEQLALATEFHSMETLGLLAPFLRKLVALRLLIPAGTPPQAVTKPYHQHIALAKEAIETVNNARNLAELVDVDDEAFMTLMGYDMADERICGSLKIVGMGWKAFELREIYKQPLMPADEDELDTPVEGQNFGRPHLPASASQSPALNANGFDVPRAPGSVSVSGTPVPASTLGKRNRDDDSDSTDRQTVPPESARVEFRTMKCAEPVVTDDGYVLKRHMRRVGWETLKHWEIWALDEQDI
ncbi:hypothetical protein N7468_001632 [Penicillium chermesinum]|uniref:F-box domain-containing protein n=1 Tax=Penicillium chermesinum TaxID=63820 RepID=A0A9W9PGW8_9EURO|nr:uncharacterized protein N7468_001632 [Penicillium chermesinum]KAJ5246649.1 hypothetical protein N7468_001632 [Penicillium chermesinum]